MKKIILGIVLILSISYGDMCSYHMDELSKAMSKTELYVENGMLTQAKITLNTAKMHAIEGIAECEDQPKAKKYYRTL